MKHSSRFPHLSCGTHWREHLAHVTHQRSQTSGRNGEKTDGSSFTRIGCTIEDYRLITRIGEGSFGEVWKAERSGFEVALKILKTSVDSDEAKRDLRSLNILKELKHPFLVHTHGFWSDGDRLYIEMELAEGGSLKDRLLACKSAGEKGIPKEELLRYFHDTASALDYLHCHRPAILHRDIKPGNILLGQGNAKLADFGLLRQVTGDHTSTKTQGGTPVYMALPESIGAATFSAAQSDLFSRSPSPTRSCVRGTSLSRA